MRSEAAVGSFFCSCCLLFLPIFPTRAALTRLEISYYKDYAVDVRIGNHNERVYASALTASYLSGTPGGAYSTPLSAGSSGSFTAFGLDIVDDLVSKAYWDPGNLPATDPDGTHGRRSPLWASGGIYRAAGLYDAYAGQVSVSTPEGRLAGAALQLAIWDVLYGDGQAVNHRGSGFFVTNRGDSESKLVLAANGMLASSANYLDLDADETFWDAELAPDGRHSLLHNQDLFGPAIRSSSVPEPSTYFAALAGMAYLSALTRRQRIPGSPRKAKESRRKGPAA